MPVPSGNGTSCAGMTKTRRPQKDRNDPLVFGYIGVVDPVKEIHHIVEAFEPLTMAELCIMAVRLTMRHILTVDSFLLNYIARRISV